MPSTKSEYASWIPDWGQSGPLIPLPIPKQTRDASGVRKIYNPWGSSTQEIERKDEATRNIRQGREAGLHITGVLLDEITCLYDIHDRSHQDLVVVRSWIERACRELGGKPYPHTGETVLRAALKTITFDVAALTANLQTFSWQHDNLDDLVNLPVEDILGKLMCPDLSIDLKDGLLRETRREMTKWRRFAIMHRGFIGMVPFHSCVGDKVFAFAGGSVLYVARELAGLFQPRYTCVGESYFHGSMDGEWRGKDTFGGPSRVVLV